MKKIFAVLATLMLSITLVGCSANPAETTYTDDAPSRFVIVEQSDLWKVVVDQETKVMYTVSWGYQNSGTFTMLVDSDGTPLLYEGEL